MRERHTTERAINLLTKSYQDLYTAKMLLLRAPAVMLRCHWNEPTGLEGDEDSALQVERDVREFLGK